jgi:drug/metabolite transporter (DMT)-like permease
MTRQQIGYSLAVTDMILYGLLPVLSHYFVSIINPLLFGGSTMILGSIPIIFVLWRSRKHTLLIRGSHIKKLVILVVLTSIGSLCFFLGTKLTSGLNTGLLTQIEPFYGLILAILLLKEKVTRSQLVSVFIMVVGAMIISYQGFDNINLGDVLILIAPLFYQLSHLVAKQINHLTHQPDLIPAARLFYGGLILFLLSLVFSPGSIHQIASINIIINLLTYAFIFRTLDLWLWYQAIHRISPAQASALIPLAGLVSVVGSIILLGEHPSLNHYIGGFLILAGLSYYSATIRKSEIQSS